MAPTPSSALAPGLHDIFYHIIFCLDPKALSLNNFGKETSESKSARKALACLARSHSSFTQPALAAMWRSLPTHEALEHLLCVIGIAHKPPIKDVVYGPTPQAHLVRGSTAI